MPAGSEAPAVKADKPKADKPKVDKPKAQQSKPKADKPKADKPKTKSYTVRKGDSLGKIASRHGLTVQQLKKANGLKNDRINVGQKLTIPVK